MCGALCFGMSQLVGFRSFDGTFFFFSSVGHNCLFSISAVYSLRAGRFWRGLASCSVEHAALVGWDHVLDVDERVITAVRLEHFKCFRDFVAEVVSLALSIVDLVTLVQILSLEQVHDWQDLTVVGHQSFTNSLAGHNESLKDGEGSCNNFGIARVKCG